MFYKFIFILLLFLNQTNVFGKVSDKKDFNQKYLSNYFSALLSYDNQENEKALQYFEESKDLINSHESFLKEYVFALVLDGQIEKAISKIKFSKNLNTASFFEAKLLLALDLIKKNKFKKAVNAINKIDLNDEKNTYEFIIFKTLASYNQLFIDKKIPYKNNEFGKLSLITNAFQNCYLGSASSVSHFLEIINSSEGDYSRYLFFYLANIIEYQDLKTAKEISNTIESFSSSLLIAQAKNWIEENNYEKFNKYFSCQNEKDILGEFFFLIANLYSSQQQFEKSNFYLNISYFLNPKFYFNLSLLAENYFDGENFDLTKKILNKFDKQDQIYDWYKIKKIGQILADQNSEKESQEYIQKNYERIQNPSIKIIYDLANIYKNFEQYEAAIELYSRVLDKVNDNSSTYADVLYRRGGSFERLGKYEEADKDLLRSLKIRSDDPYTLNYLAYSWLERKIKINEAMDMLLKANEYKKNDPYITDSVGWGYYLIEDFENAEKFLRKAVELMPDDPIVNDHYGDVLWQLNRKLQAKYFWEHTLKLDETNDEMKKAINKKLIDGPEKI